MQNNIGKLIAGLAIAVGAALLAYIINASAEVLVLFGVEFVMPVLLAAPLLFFAVTLTPGQKIYPVLLYAVIIALTLGVRGYFILLVTAVPALVFALMLNLRKPFLESVTVCSGVLVLCAAAALGIAYLLMRQSPYTALETYLRGYLASDGASVSGFFKMAMYDPYSVSFEEILRLTATPLNASEINALVGDFETALSVGFPYCVIKWSLGVGFWSYFLVGSIAKAKGAETGNIPSMDQLRLPNGAKHGVLAAAVVAIVFGVIDSEQYSALIFSTISVFSYILAVQGLSAVFFLAKLNQQSGRTLKGLAVAVYILAPSALSIMGLIDMTMNLRRRDGILPPAK